MEVKGRRYTSAMDEATIRAWWSHRQGLDGRLSGRRASEVLEETGWARSVGGVGRYLTLFARAGAGRAAVDAAVASLEIQELPCARGCNYVAPASDFALALKIGQGFAGERKTAEKLGVTGGEIRRIPTNGRLDQQRYRYALWRPNPLAGFRLSAEEAAMELARRFFAWIGPATLAEFQGFSGLGAKAAKAAVEPLKLESADGRMLLPGHRQEIESFEAPPRALHNRKGRRFGRARCF